MTDARTYADTDRYTVISADCHAGADLLDYRPYLAARHHDAFDAWAATYVNPYEDLLADTADRNWNSERRVAELEADGIVAEVIAQLQSNGAWFGEFSNKKKDGTRP